MTRQEALNLLSDKLKNKNLYKHCLAVEACLKGLARRLGENEENWGLAGLLHDVDYEITGADPARHGLEGAALLEEMGLDKQLVHAVKVHSGHVPASTTLDWALFATDPLTGLIVASALMHPEIYTSVPRRIHPHIRAKRSRHHACGIFGFTFGFICLITSSAGAHLTPEEERDRIDQDRGERRRDR